MLIQKYWILLLFIVLQVELGAGKRNQRPNIIIVLVDDLGWNDVGFHASTDIVTPNIDKLSQGGITLSNYYVSPMCTPTRAALMTGKHPIHLGLQSGVIGARTPYGLGLNEKTMGQHFKKLGYKTHLVGKWHLGHFADEYLPLNRGFDSHHGYLTGREDYFDHTCDDVFDGIDFRNMNAPDRKDGGKYSTDFYGAHSVDIIKTHNKSEPLFLYVASQGVHAGNGNDPLQAPQQYVNRNRHIKDPRRRIFAGMVTAVDDLVGNITNTLKESGMLSNSIIVFSTDNGGPTHGIDLNEASNWPLRGLKFTLWEGGIRGAGFINSDLLKHSGYVSSELMHITDWLPTLYTAAGGDVHELGDIYGVSAWSMLSNRGAQIREELLHNIDPVANRSAIRMDNYKLLVGDISDGQKDGWYPPPDLHQQSLNRKDMVNPIKVECGAKPYDAATNCYTKSAMCLYDVSKDPCEYTNIAKEHPHIVEILYNRIKYWSSTAVPVRNKPDDPRSNPKYHDGFWGPWINISDSKQLKSIEEL